MGKKGVVLCGGGAKGAYQIGVWKALKKLKFNPEVVTGTSVGALNGSLMVMDDFKKAYDTWMNIDMKQIFSFKSVDLSKAKNMSDLTKMLIKSGESASYEPLQKLIKECIDEDKIRKSNIDFGFVTTQFVPLKKVEIYKEDIPKGKMCDYVMASAACYPYMKSFSIGSKKYIDGGFFDNMPIEMAIKKGATDIVVVDLKAAGIKNKFSNLNANITYIGSRHDLGEIMIFDNDNSLRNMKYGYYDTLKTFNKLEGDLYTFKKGSNIKASKYEDDMEESYKKIFSRLPIVNPFENMARTNIEDYLKNYNKELFSINSNVLTSLEFAANIFNIDMLNVYSFNEYRKLIIKKYETCKKTNEYKKIFDLNDAIKKVLKPDGIKDLVQTYDKDNLVVYIVNLLSKKILNFDDKKEIWVFSVIYPDVVLASIALSAILTKKKFINGIF